MANFRLFRPIPGRPFDWLDMVERQLIEIAKDRRASEVKIEVIEYDDNVGNAFKCIGVFYD